MHCFSCGSELRDGVKACTTCGTLVPLDEAANSIEVVNPDKAECLSETWQMKKLWMYIAAGAIFVILVFVVWIPMVQKEIIRWTVNAEMNMIKTGKYMGENLVEEFYENVTDGMSDTGRTAFTYVVGSADDFVDTYDYVMANMQYHINSVKRTQSGTYVVSITVSNQDTLYVVEQVVQNSLDAYVENGLIQQGLSDIQTILSGNTHAEFNNRFAEASKNCSYFVEGTYELEYEKHFLQWEEVENDDIWSVIVNAYGISTGQ